MLILGIETATERIGVGLVGSEGILATFEATRGRHHAEIVVPAIEFVCRHADVSVDELSSIAVDVGPGLFTGMRVGLATAKSMAAALEIPIVGLTSLEILAHSCRHSDRIICSVVDARKGQVFFGFHRATVDGIESLGQAQAGQVQDLIGAIEDRDQTVVCVGDGAQRYRDDLEGHSLIDFADRHLAHPSVDQLLIMGMRRALREQWSSVSDVHAMYLRPPDAEINWSIRTNAAAAEAST